MRTPMSLKTDVWRSYLRSGYLCTTKSSGWIVNSAQASTPASAGHRRSLAEWSGAKSEKEDDNAVSSVPAEGCKPSRSVQSISGDEHTSDPISRGAATPSGAVYRRRARANCGVCVRIESLPLLSRCPQRDGGAPGHQARIGG